MKNASLGSASAIGLRTPITSGSIQMPGTMPSALIASITWGKPPVNRVVDGTHSPTVSHHPSPGSAYQPASMQKYSAPARAAARMSGSSRSVVGFAFSVFR